MTIACLGWGSLIWKPGDLAAGEWLRDGPELPVEFARQSRDGRITLVIAKDAKPVPVLWVPLNVGSAEDARATLADREDCDLNAVGFWTPGGASNLSETQTVGNWAVAKAIKGVVWTALKPKFADEYRKPSVEEVTRYLAGLSGVTKARAEEYVRRAPVQIRTSYRDRIEGDLGWHPMTLES